MLSTMDERQAFEEWIAPTLRNGSHLNRSRVNSQYTDNRVAAKWAAWQARAAIASNTQPKETCLSAKPDAPRPNRPDDFCPDQRCGIVGQCLRTQSPAPAHAPSLFPNGLNITKEWLADKLAQGDDSDAAAGQPKRPCDTPPGCNGSNCQGCGEKLTPFSAVERALELSSLHAGSVAMNDRDGATAYRQQLRAHLVEHMYPAPAAQAPAVKD